MIIVVPQTIPNFIFIAFFSVIMIITTCRPNAAYADNLRIYLPEFSPAPENMDINNLPNLPPENLANEVVTEEVSAKIKKRHQEEFGPMATAHLSAEYRELVNSEFGQFNRSFQGSYLYLNEKTKSFGEYAAKEIMDYHLDNYLKRNINTRRVYKGKRQLTRQDIQFNSNIKAECRVSLPNQEVEIRLINPYLNIITRKELTNEREFSTIINKKLAYKYKIEAVHKSYDGTLSFVTHKIINPNLEASITYNTYTKPEGPTPRENSLILGMSYIF